MKYTVKNKLYPALALGMGAVGALARAALYRIVPEGGMLPKFHPLILLCWVLAAAFAIALIPAVRKAKPSSEFRRSFPKTTNLLPLGVIAGAGLLVTVLQGLTLSSKLHLVWLILGLLSVPALVIIGWLRTRGSKPVSWLYSVVCLFYGVHLICCYQSWSANPQTIDYSFQLLACACLILAAYQRSAFSAGLGQRRMHLFFSLMAGFFCTACIVHSDFPWLYLTQGAFFLCDLTFRNKK